MDRKNKSWLIKIGVLGVVVGTYYFVPAVHSAVNKSIFILSMVNIPTAREFILSFGIWAPVVSFVLMVLQSLIAPLPAFIITFANAGLFGWIKGAILSWSSAMAGAVLCYAISRLYGRAVVEKLASRSALKQVDIFFEKYGKWAILVARLLPFVSFDVVSYAAGLTTMGFWEFFWATGLGQLPATIIYSYVGGMLVGSVKTFVFGLLSLFALSIVIFVIRQSWTEKGKVDQ